MIVKKVKTEVNSIKLFVYCIIKYACLLPFFLIVKF